MEKEQYRNNFGCYSFVYRSDVRHHVPTFRKKWLVSWMRQWFYVNKDLVEREDVKVIIQCPIQSRFGIRRPSIMNSDKAQACLVAFNTVCSYIGTRDLIQDHIAFKLCPLVNEWEMSKEATDSSSEGGLVYLKYSYRYRSQFREPNDEWLEAIEVTSDDLLGAYTKAKDEAMNIAFGVRGKKRLNRVFDVIGFAYPDYCFLAWKQGTKKRFASTTPSTMLKPKRLKVVTHRSKSYFLEGAVTLLVAGVSKAKAVESAEDILPTSKVVSVAAAEVPTIQLEKSEPESSKSEQQSKLQSPTVMPGLTRTAIVPAATPRKGRRMASVLDAVLRPSKMATPAPTRVSEDKVEELEEIVAASAAPDCTKAGPSETRPMEQIIESLREKLSLLIPEEASVEDLDFIIRHALGKQLTQRQIAEAQHYAKELKYPRGSLVYELRR
jgi:hypothetical protein